MGLDADFVTADTLLPVWAELTNYFQNLRHIA